jgi:hypothetical protein
MIFERVRSGFVIILLMLLSQNDIHEHMKSLLASLLSPLAA